MEESVWYIVYLYLLAMEELFLTPVAVQHVYGGRYSFSSSLLSRIQSPVALALAISFSLSRSRSCYRLFGLTCRYDAIHSSATEIEVSQCCGLQMPLVMQRY